MDSKNARVATIDLITRYFHALTTGNFNDSLFTPEVTLLTPFLVTPIVGKDAVIGELKEISKDVADIKILRFVVEAEFACTIIEFKNKAGILVNMCDTYRIANGKIAEIHPYFDPRPLIGDGQAM